MAVRDDAFPEEAEIEFERSLITIPIYAPDRPPPPKESYEEGWPGDPVEILENDAFMRLERGRPTRNYLGYRQFEFQIAEWELIGRSELLGATVTFTLSKAVQPRSLCRANEHESDFPAEIYYSAIYDVYVGQERIIANQPGIAYAREVRSIPPRDVLVAFEKPYESNRFVLGPGCCGGMQSISPEEFEEGRARGYAERGWR